MATFDDVQTDMDSARTLMAAGSWAAARDLLLQAYTTLVTLPQGKQGASEVRLTLDVVKDLLDRIEKRTNATEATDWMRRTRVTYTTTTTD